MSSRLDRNSSKLGQPPRVVMVDDDESLQEAMRAYFIRPAVGWQVDSYADAASALKDILATPPHVVLMEVALQCMSAIECIRKLKVELPDLPVVMFTARSDTGTLLNAMMAGACGYVIKPVAPADLLPHVRKALAGGLAIGPRAERFLLEGFRELRRSGSASGLSWREQEIMLGISRHKSEKEIGKELRIETGTVHAHLMKTFKKLAVHGREAAVRRFLKDAVGGGVINRTKQSVG